MASDNTELNQLICNAADQQNQENYEKVFAKLLDAVLYFIVQSDEKIEAGERLVTDKDNIKIAIKKLNENTRAIILYTHKDESKLGQNEQYAGMAGADALRMALGITGLDGVIIQSKQAAWVGLDLDNIKVLLTEKG